MYIVDSAPTEDPASRIISSNTNFKKLARESAVCNGFIVNCRSLIKVKFPTDQFRPALGSCCRLIVTMLKKPQNCPISDFFDLYPNTFCPYCFIQT